MEFRDPWDVMEWLEGRWLEVLVVLPLPPWLPLHGVPNAAQDWRVKVGWIWLMQAGFLLVPSRVAWLSAWPSG